VVKFPKRTTLHDMRKPLRSTIQEKGWANKAVAEAILGHSTPGIEGIYNMAQFTGLQGKALQRWCDYLDALAGKTAAGVVNLDAARAKA
jgi:hypothetical protein